MLAKLVIVIALCKIGHAQPSLTDPLPAPAPAAPMVGPVGGTTELAMGPGAIRVGETSITGLGLSGGFGYFVSPQVALGLRVSGIDRGGYTGMAGPHLQVWLGDDVFVGAGGGIGFYALCDVVLGCASEAAAAGTARIGLVATRIGFTRLSVSFEVIAMEPKSTGWMETYSFMVGGQTF